MAKTITAANCILTLAIVGLYNVPQRLQGFDVDDVFDTDAITTGEVRMGVDGRMSAGFVYEAVKVGIHLQADSDSNVLFETWAATQRAQAEVMFAEGLVVLPSIGRSYVLHKGILSAVPQISPVKRVLGARTYGITFESVLPAPV